MKQDELALLINRYINESFIKTIKKIRHYQRK